MIKMSECVEKKFPSFFPENIIPEDAEYREEKVYRICRWGKIDKDAFISTYEEYIRGNIQNKDLDLSDPGTYSTSTFFNKRDARGILKCITRYKPAAIVALGKTNPEYGPIQVTKNRTGQKNSHVDWWLFEQADPSDEFEEVDVYEK